MDYLNLGCGYHFHPDWTNIDFVSTGQDVLAHNLREGIPFPDASFDVVYHSHVLEHFPRSEAEQFLQECHRVLRPHGILRVVVPDLEQIVRLYLKAMEEASNGSEEWAENYDWLLLEMYDQTVRNFSGGEMAAYLARENIPNLSFILKRIGTEGKNLVKALRQSSQPFPSDPSTAYATQNPNELALKIGRFRLGGEVHQWMYDRFSISRLLNKVGFSDIRICKANESRIPEFYRFDLDIEPDGKIRKPDSLFVEAVESRPNIWRQQFQFSNPKALTVAQINTVDSGGGAARAAQRLHKGLLKAGQKSLLFVNQQLTVDETVLLVKPIHQRDQAEQASCDAIQNYYINANRTKLSNTCFSFPYPGIDLSQIDEIIEADIINLHWIAFFQSPETIKRLLSLGKPIVWTLHDMWAFTGGCHYSAGCNQYMMDCMNCPQLQNDPCNLTHAVLQDKLACLTEANLTIVTPSYWLADCARQSRLFRNCRIEVIPNALETDVFIPLPKSEAKAALSLDRTVFALLIGADNGNEHRKGFTKLLEALNLCLQDPRFQDLVRKNKFCLLCFGLPNPELDALPIPVHSLGQIHSDTQLCQVYSAADLFVLPSLEDNLPNTMLEALSCSTPVLGFEIGGLPDLIQDGITGRLVQAGDTFGMSQAIIDCVLAPQQCEQMGQNGRQVIETSYSLINQAEAYLALYEDLLQSKPNHHKFETWSECHEKRQEFSKSNIYSVKAPLVTTFSLEAGFSFAQASMRALADELSQYKTQPQPVEIAIPHPLEERLAQKQKELKQTKTQLRKTKAQLEEHRTALQEIHNRVHAMETSKFWKARSLWFRLKARIGLSKDGV